MKSKIFTLFCLFLIFFPLARTVKTQWVYYKKPFDVERVKELYSISQYVRTSKAAWIADEFLYSYAAWYYINGGNPILVNPETPPLAKYLIGFSIKYFNNEKIPSVLFGFLSLFTLYLIARLFFKEAWIALLPVAFFVWEKLFLQQLEYLPLLEIFALTFLNLAIYFFIKAQDKNGYFFLANFFLGVLWATRPWMATVPLVASWAVYFLLEKDYHKLFLWLVSTPAAFIPLLFSYSKLFIEGWSLYKVLSVQKWILWYHSSRLINFGSIWPFIYLKRWYVWWGDQPYVQVDQWNIFWPIFTTLALILALIVLFNKLRLKIKFLPFLKFDKKVIPISLWVLFYLCFLSVGNINTRYFFYLLPYCYLSGVLFLKLLVFPRN